MILIGAVCWFVSTIVPHRSTCILCYVHTHVLSQNKLQLPHLVEILRQTVMLQFTSMSFHNVLLNFILLGNVYLKLIQLVNLLSYGPKTEVARPPKINQKSRWTFVQIMKTFLRGSVRNCTRHTRPNGGTSKALSLHTEGRLHQSVVGEGNAPFPQPAVATFVDELTHRLQVGVSGGTENTWLWNELVSNLGTFV